MLFNNPKIIKTPADARVGGIECEDDRISFNDYKLKVRERMLALVVQYVKSCLSDGGNKEAIIAAIWSAVHSYLNIPTDDEHSDEDNVLTEEAVVDAIVNSLEYKNWETKIHGRFLNIHYGVISSDTPIDVSGAGDEPDEEDNEIYSILEGLIAANNE